MTGDTRFLPSRRRFLAASLSGGVVLSRADLAKSGSVPAPAVSVEPAGYGPGFQSLAITRDGKTAYVAFGLSDTLLRINLTTGEIAGAIDVSPAGFLLQSALTALSPDSRWLAVANMGAGSVMIVDTAAQTVSQVLSIPINVACFAFARDGRLFVRHIDGGLMVAAPPLWAAARINLPGLIISAMSPSASQPHLLYCLGAQVDRQPWQNVFFRFDVVRGVAEAITPIPQRAWVQLAVPEPEDFAYCGWNLTPGDRFTGELWVFDLRALKFVSTTTMDYGIQDFAINEPARKIYIAGCWSGGSAPGTIPIIEWDMATQAISRRMTMSPAASTVAIRCDPSDPRYVYSTDADHNILRRTDVLVGAEVMRTRLSRQRLGLGPAVVAGDTAFFCCSFNANIVKFDLKSGVVTGLIPSPTGQGTGGGGYLNGQLYFPSNRDLYILDATTGNVLRRQTLETNVNGALTFSRGKAFNLARVGNPWSGTRVLQFDAATFKLLRTSDVLPEPGADRGILSPDGAKLYTCNAQVGQNARLVILDAETLALRKAIDIPSDFSQGGATNFASWDFDLNNRLLYMAGFNSVYVMHLDRDVILQQLNVLDALKAAGKPQGNGGTAISGVYLSPAKDLLMVVSSDFSTMYVYDLRRAQWQPRLVDLRGYLPRHTCRSEDGRLVYAACEMSDSISQVDATSGTLLKVVPVTAPWTGLDASNLRHAASYVTGAVSPGQLLVVYGEYIGPNVFTRSVLDSSRAFPTQLAGTRVLFDGIAAPLLFAYTTMIGAIVPYAIGGSGSVKVEVESKGERSNAISLPVSPATPGIFTADSSGQGQAAALNQDGRLNSPANPAPRGSVVVCYATGAGQTDPPGVDGEVATGILPRPRLPVKVYIQGREAEVLYAGAAPGLVAGVMQVNTRLPMDIPSDDRVTVVLVVDNAVSQAGVTVAVR